MIRYINLTNRGFLKQYFFKKIKVTFKIFFIVVFLTLAVDFLFGKFLLSTFDKKSKPLPYVDHDIYDHTLKKILSIGKDLNGYILILDLLNLNFRKVKLNKFKNV